MGQKKRGRCKLRNIEQECQTPETNAKTLQLSALYKK